MKIRIRSLKVVQMQLCLLDQPSKLLKKSVAKVSKTLRRFQSCKATMTKFKCSSLCQKRRKRLCKAKKVMKPKTSLLPRTRSSQRRRLVTHKESTRLMELSELR